MDASRIEAGKKYVIEMEGHVSEMLARFLAADPSGSWVCVRSGDGKRFTVAPSEFQREVAHSE
jgi:hypothetical protein